MREGLRRGGGYSLVGGQGDAREGRELARVTIREEFVALTGDHVKAAILDRFDQLQKKVKDFDRFIREEKARASSGGGEVGIEETGGWIYKDAAELAVETMLSVSERTLNRRLEELVKRGLLLRRRNPKHQWDRTWQYRLDLFALRTALAGLGYPLEGWFFPPDGGSDGAAPANDAVSLGSDTASPRNVQDGDSKGHGGAAIPVGSIDDGDLPSVDQSGAPTPEDGAEPPVKMGGDPLLRDVLAMDDGRVGDEAEEVAALLVAGFAEGGRDLGAVDAARLAQLCIERGLKNTLLRVAQRVSRKDNVEHPFRYLVKSVAEEPEETALASRVRSRVAGVGSQGERSGARRRKEGYEWLFGEEVGRGCSSSGAEVPVRGDPVGETLQ